MAIIRCDDGIVVTEGQEDSTSTTVNADGSVTTINADGSTTTVYIDGTIVTVNVDETVTIISPDGVETNMSSSDYFGVTEEYVDQDKVSLGKKLLAVENEAFSKLSVSLDSLPEVRNEDIADTFRADTGLYWTFTEEAAMRHPALSYVLLGDPTNTGVTLDQESGKTIGLEETHISLSMIGNDNVFPNDGVWKVFLEGGDYYKGDVKEFSRPSPLIPVGQTFSDHAFEMNAPFSKKELEMFANISNAVSVADVESDYDFFAESYEEKIATTTVPENSLPHLYTEVQRGESDTANTDELPQGYFRQWIEDVFSSQDEMNRIAENYENVAILDSVVSEENIIDSTREDIESGDSATTSAFEILMAYANRENLFPMNINIEMDTSNASDLMFEAEDVGMVDDIVRLVMGEGDVVAVTETEAPTLDPDDAPTDEVDFEIELNATVWKAMGSKISFRFGMNYDYEENYTTNSSESGDLWNLIRDEFDSYGGYNNDSTFVQYVFEVINRYIESKDTKNGTHDITYELNSNNYMYSHDDGVTYIQHGTNTDDTSDTKVEITVVEDTGWVYIMLYALENRG
jgi:hypothetical protein|tara:strand:- start:1071 stop:2789 length:1719 start_codon:yes stop_codon:yes gene_type:complete